MTFKNGKGKKQRQMKRLWKNMSADELISLVDYEIKKEENEKLKSKCVICSKKFKPKKNAFGKITCSDRCENKYYKYLVARYTNSEKGKKKRKEYYKNHKKEKYGIENITKRTK